LYSSPFWDVLLFNIIGRYCRFVSKKKNLLGKKGYVVVVVLEAMLLGFFLFPEARLLPRC